MTRQQLILAALKAAGEQGLTTAQMCQKDVGGRNFPARVQELREQGHNIINEPIRQGSWRYWLKPSDVEAGAGDTAASRSPSQGAVVGSGQARPGVRLGIGPIVPYHACDAPSCGYRWKEVCAWWPSECPSCGASVAWISSFRHRFEAKDHVPLTRRPDTQLAEAA